MDNGIKVEDWELRARDVDVSLIEACLAEGGCSSRVAGYSMSRTDVLDRVVELTRRS